MKGFLIFTLGGGRKVVKARAFATGDETKHGFDSDENYKDLTIQKQNRGKNAAVLN